MIIIVIISSIFAIIFAARLVSKLTPIRICPICAGVAGTWLWLLAGMFTGLLPPARYELPTAILMGGSIVGIAYQIEKKILALPSRPPQKSSVIFKVLFIPAGFAAVYFLILSQWSAFVLTILFLAVLTKLFIKNSGKIIKTNKMVEEIKKNMENCC